MAARRSRLDRDYADDPELSALVGPCRCPLRCRRQYLCKKLTFLRGRHRPMLVYRLWKSLEFRRTPVDCFSRRERSAHICVNGSSEQRGKQPTGRGPEGCVENGSAASLLVSHVSIQICSFSASPARTASQTTHLNATKLKGIRRRYTRLLFRVGAMFQNRLPGTVPPRCLS